MASVNTAQWSQPLIITGEAIAKTLSEFCANGTPAVVVTMTGHGVHQARFARIASKQVSLEVFDDVSADLFVPTSFCSISVNIGDRAGMFVAPIESFNDRRDAPLPPLLVLAHPQQIVRVEVRRTFRLPVHTDLGMRLTLHLPGGRTVVTRPLDLSITGMSCEFPVGQDPEIAVGSLVPIELRLTNYTVKFTAQIRRHHRRRYGLMFQEMDKSGPLDVPEAFKTILKAVEQRWLESRKK